MLKDFPVVSIIVLMLVFVVWNLSNWFECRGKGGAYIDFQCIKVTRME